MSNMNTIKTMLTMMRKLGYNSDFVRSVLLPDFFSLADPESVQDIDHYCERLRQFLPPDASPRLSPAKLRKVKQISTDRLQPAIHIGLSTAGAVVNNIVNVPTFPKMPPQDPHLWRKELLGNNQKPITLRTIVAALWQLGVPVVRLKHTTSPSYQAMACRIQSRPAIVIGHNIDNPARLAFTIAHEVGHIVNNHVGIDNPIVDELDPYSGDTAAPSDSIDSQDVAMEHAADQFAFQVMSGNSPAPAFGGSDPKTLAYHAYNYEKEHSVDAAFALLVWARQENRFALANLAIRALDRLHGGNSAIDRETRLHVQTSSNEINASDSDTMLSRLLLNNIGR